MVSLRSTFLPNALSTAPYVLDEEHQKAVCRGEIEKLDMEGKGKLSSLVRLS